MSDYVGKISIDEIAEDLRQLIEQGSPDSVKYITEKYKIRDTSGEFGVFKLGNEFTLLALLAKLKDMAKDVENNKSFISNLNNKEIERNVDLIKREVQILKEELQQNKLKTTEHTTQINELKRKVKTNEDNLNLTREDLQKTKVDYYKDKAKIATLNNTIDVLKNEINEIKKNGVPGGGTPIPDTPPVEPGNPDDVPIAPPQEEPEVPDYIFESDRNNYNVSSNEDNIVISVGSHQLLIPRTPFVTEARLKVALKKIMDLHDYIGETNRIIGNIEGYNNNIKNMLK